MRRHCILFLFSVSFLFSCGRTYRLSEGEYQWMPYKGNETLVFKSATGETDTIFLLKKDTLLAYPEAQSFNGTKYEMVSVFCMHYARNMEKGKRRDVKHYFFHVERGKDGRSKINIDLRAHDAVFYRISPLRTDSLNKVKPVTLQTAYGRYDDVYVIAGEDFVGTFRQRSNFVTKVYWSKSHGLVRYDKDGGIYWELLKKQ